MAVKYYLKPNLLTPDPNDQKAGVEAVAVREVPDVIKEMMNRGTTVNYPDALATIDLFFKVMIDIITDGSFVNTPVANFKPSITGVFTSPTDNFDRSRHILRASISQGIELNKAFRDAQVSKITRPDPEPELIEFFDVVNGEANVSVMVGGIGQITGTQLKYNPENPQEGIFFVDDGGVETKVTVVQKRTEGMLVFINPDTLTPGSYRLIVKKGYGKVPNIRVGELQHLLTAVLP